MSLRRAIVVLILMFASAASASDDVLVEIDGRAIRESDLSVSSFLLGKAAAVMPADKVRNLVLAHLVDQKSLVALAERNGASRDVAALVARSVADKAAPPPPDETPAARTQRVDYVVENSMAERLLAEVDRRHPAADTELRRRYDVLAAATEVRLRLIVVPTRAKADEIKLRLAGGADFEAVAREVSVDDDSREKGGDLGYLAETALTPAFAGTVAGMSVRQISDPVDSGIAWNLVKLIDRRRITIKSFDEMKPDLAKAFRDEERAKYVADVRGRTPIKWHVAPPPGY